MIELPGGGAVIDSPGVRDYAPAVDSPDRVVVGFREIAAHGARCKFANCRHLHEPGCAVKSAVDAGAISGRRYESYRRMFARLEEFFRPKNDTILLKRILSPRSADADTKATGACSA